MKTLFATREWMELGSKAYLVSRAPRATSPCVEIHADIVPRQPDRPGAMGKYLNPHVVLTEREVPVLLPGMVLVEVWFVGVCGSDLHALQTDAQGYSMFSGPSDCWEHGLQLGHEFVGRVVARGPGVKIAIGTIVTADSLVPCRQSECGTCEKENFNYCPNAYLIGLEAHGAFGELACVPASALHPIDVVLDSLGFEEGCRAAVVAEPLAVGLHAFGSADSCVRHARRSRRSALIHGGGMIGVAIGIAAREHGYSPVVISEPNQARAERAKLFMEYVVHPDELEEIEFWMNAFGKFGPTVVAEASGVVDIATAAEQVEIGGAVVGVARTGQNCCVASDLMMTEGKTITWARGHVGYLPKALSLLARHDLALSELISRDLHGLDQLHVALQKPELFADDTKVVCEIKRSF